MASPFNIFRRNQRVMMALLTVMAMFAFVFMDPSLMRSGAVSRALTVFLIAGLFGLGMWFVGIRHGKSNEWSLWGALAGAVAAFLFVTYGQNDTAVHTAIGGYSSAELQAMTQKRFQVNQFLHRAAQAAKSTRPVQDFGPGDERSMLQFALAREEVKRMGLALDDAAVNRFIGEVTDNKLSRGDISKVLREVNISEGDLVNSLRAELEARLALEVQTPMYDTWRDINFQTFQQFNRPKVPATPEEDWKLFLKLNQKQTLSVVALPVNSFIEKMPDPSEAELIAFFDARKDKQPGPKGEPGFVQPPRVKLAYLAADFEKYEEQVTSPTDEEVAEFYEKNKARYQIREIPDSPDSDAPVDALNPGNVAPVIPDLDPPTSDDSKPDDAKTPDKKDKDAKPDANSEAKPDPKTEPSDSPDKKPDEPAEKKPDGDAKQDEQQPDEKQSGESSTERVTGTAAIRLVSAVADETESKEEDKPAAEKSEAVKDDQPADDKKPAEPTEGSTPADTENKADAENKKDGKKTEQEPGAESGDEPLLPPGPKGDEKPVRYRPLDDDLQATIREEIMRDKAFEKMGEAVDAAQNKMKDLAYEYLEAAEGKKEQMAAEIAATLKKYAEQHGLEYVETKFLSRIELGGEPIGSAVLPLIGAMQFQSISVMDEVFPMRSGQSSVLYFPQRADSRVREKRYAWWKIEDNPQHEPRWDEEGIAEQVKTAWKYEKGRELAQKRGEQLLELAKAEPQDLTAALAGQTVTGEPGTASVVIKETPRFSWLTTSMNVPMDPEMGDFLAPRRSFIDGVDLPGEDFMDFVFDKLKPDELGVAANSQRSIFYLVQVRDRDGTEASSDVEGYLTLVDLRTQFLSLQSSERREFLLRPFNLMQLNAFSRIQQEWAKAFDSRYGVEFDEPESVPAKSGSKRR